MSRNTLVNILFLVIKPVNMCLEDKLIATKNKSSVKWEIVRFSETLVEKSGTYGLKNCAHFFSSKTSINH